MLLLRNSFRNKQIFDSVVVIGNFDGVHLGHREVIMQAKKIAEEKKKKLGLITFEPHPKCFFTKKRNGFRLTPFRTKFELVRELKVNYYFNFKFDKYLSKITAEDFVYEYLIKKMKVSHIVTGKDFVFGTKQKGNIYLLKKISEQSNKISCSTVNDKILSNNIKFSSSIIRKNLEIGNLKTVFNLLGRSWCVKARVIKGESRGKTIGFPTANFDITEYSNLCYGVYAVSVKIYKQKYIKYVFNGIANYGVKPTFFSLKPTLEVNIFDFNELIYGELVEITFKYFIRKEKKFDNIIDLQKQIKFDIVQARNFLKDE